MTRSLYRSLLWLHPPAFRRQFAGEMLWIFDQAAPAEGSLRLMLDGVLSLLRQWVLGCGAWKALAGALVASLQLLFVAPLANLSHFAPSQRPIPAALSYSDFEFSRALLLLFVLLVGLIGFLGVLRARTASRH
jgi:hypothetical protein